MSAVVQEYFWWRKRWPEYSPAMCWESAMYVCRFL